MPPSLITSTFLDVYNPVAALFIVADVVLVVAFIYVYRKAWHFHPTYEAHAGHGAAHRETIHDIVMRERWHTIQARLASGTPEAARLAIIDADALVDSVLKGMGVEGEHLADRLSNLDTDGIASMPRIWRAHRMRNDLVHTPGFEIAQGDAERVMRDYEAFLRDLHVIE